MQRKISDILDIYSDVIKDEDAGEILFIESSLRRLLFDSRTDLVVARKEIDDLYMDIEELQDQIDAAEKIFNGVVDIEIGNVLKMGENKDGC